MRTDAGLPLPALLCGPDDSASVSASDSPHQQKGVTNVLVGRTAPGCHSTMHQVGNGVDKLHDSFLKHFCGVCEAPYVTEAKDTNLRTLSSPHSNQQNHQCIVSMKFMQLLLPAQVQKENPPNTKSMTIDDCQENTLGVPPPCVSQLPSLQFLCCCSII
jgi:hypothetical protein